MVEEATISESDESILDGVSSANVTPKASLNQSAPAKMQGKKKSKATTKWTLWT